MLWRSVLVLGVARLAFGTPLQRRWDDFAEKHSWLDVPKGWSFESAAPPDYSFDLRIGLKQDKFDQLLANLMETSDPFHEKYGRHLSKEEVDALIAPHPDSIREVEAWLTFHGIETVQRTNAGDWITVRVSVAQAERMLGTKYNVYRHAASSERVVRTMSYSLPRGLHAHIDVAAPATYFGPGTMRSMHATSFLQPEIKNATDANEADCNNVITPACLINLYKTTGYRPTAGGCNGLGVAGYLGNFPSQNDLTTFLRQYRPDAVSSSFTVVGVNGGGRNNNQSLEADLDIQYTTSISYPTPITYYSTGGSPPFIPDSATQENTNEPYVDWLNFILGQDTIPQTITSSYGDDEQTVPRDYAASVCNLFAQLGARGVTFFSSSGDYGVGKGSCSANDGTNTVKFQPAFPASCPFVTAVGGTTGINPEVAAALSGGGFSNYFSQPSYQAAAVHAFLSDAGNPNQGFFNARGRAYPDIAAQATNFQVVVGGAVQYVAGTSASSPTVASIFALLNDFLLSKGKPSLGFINPLLYARGASSLNDITSGSNPGCGTNGFSSRAGWDPVTGLGTPDFLKLQTLIS